MSATEADVLVVGGGPAGAATAAHLARNGADVVVVDKATFPREKVCGDGLTPRGVKALHRVGVDPTEPGFVSVRGLRTHGAGVKLELPWPRLRDFPDFGVVRTRHDLDHLLLQRAQKDGARVWEGAEALEPRVERGWVAGAMVRRQPDAAPVEVRARFVVACDGASSRFAQRAGVRRDPSRPIGVAARRYYRSPHDPGGMFESWLELWDGPRQLPGYGWVFPVEPGLLNVGAGLINTYRRFRDVSARHAFDVFARGLPPEWALTEENAVGPVLSGPLPTSLNRRPLATPGLLLVGDAAGAVNPFNGEGIAYALETGELAAELIHAAIERDRPALAHLYPIELRRRYGRYFTLGRAFVKLIGNPAVMRAATRYGLPRRRLMAFLLRTMANLTDGRDGDLEDRVLHALVRLAPER
ncbi:MAG TPA: geranylgeranyl reductase family protein [Actinomycetota bacterium]|nr:geranylgeranyl reductase family protein [Actinomycetota bacterium]